jgi:tetratricopeptide (TPR) repeat protein
MHARQRALRVVETAESAAGLEGPEFRRAQMDLVAARDEVVDAMEYLLEHEPDSALRLSAVLSGFWQDAARVDDGRRCTAAAIDAASAAPTKALARSLLVLAELAFRQGDQDDAEAACFRAIEVARAAQDDGTIALAHVNLARVAFRRGDAAAIEGHATEALRGAADDVNAWRGALHMLGWAAYTAGDLPLARSRFEESLAYRRQLGDPFSIAVEVANIGDLAIEAGDLGDGSRRLAEALRIGADLGSAYLVLNLLPSIAAIAGHLGRDADAARLMGAADAVSRSSGLLPDPGAWQPVLDEVEARLGDSFTTLRTEGAACEQAEAVARALEIADATSRPRSAP